MSDKASDETLSMSVVVRALTCPPERREAYIHAACDGDSTKIREICEYIEWEERMKGFLEKPLFSPPPDEPPFTVGDLVAARFRILGEIGEGGMGWVYKAQDEKLGIEVAIKCAKSGFHKRLPPEVWHAREISHKNVCKVFDIHTGRDERGDIEFISMEFLEGETLAARLSRGSLPQQKALAFARQIANGLAEAHRKGVVHGDVKSNNVILTRGQDGAERAVITDFGLARRPGIGGVHGLAESMAGGAMDYIAPEVWNGAKSTAPSDVYGLGVILCEIFTGRRPFGPETPVEKRRKPPAMHAKWDWLLGRCLHPDPSRRFKDADEVATALDRKTKIWRWGSGIAALVITFIGAGAPDGEVIRLAILPFEAPSELVALSQGSLLEAGNRLKSSRTHSLTLIPVSDALQNDAKDPAKARTLLGATDALTGEWQKDDDGIKISAHLIDTSSLAHLQDWQFKYSIKDVPTIPVALASMVSNTLKLKLVAAATVNNAAYSDYLQGVALARRDPDLDRAIPLLRHAVDLDPGSPLTYAKLAEAQWLMSTLTRRPERDEWQRRAETSLAQAEGRNRDVVEVRLVSGMINDGLGLYDEARADLLRAVELDPANGDAWRQLGKVFEHAGQSAEALEAYHKALRFQPEYFKNYEALGAYYFNRGDYEEAEEYCRKMRDLVPDWADAHYALAAPYLNMRGRERDAEVELNLAKSIQDTGKVELGFGFLRLSEGRPDKAIDQILTAIEIARPPTSAYYMDLGTAYRRDGNMPKAIESYQHGVDLARDEIEENPSDGYARSCRAYMYAQLNRPGDAGEEIEAALKFSRGANNVRWMAVQTYAALHDYDTALDLLQDAPRSIFFRVGRSPDLTQLVASPGYKRLLVIRKIQ